ncbi:hypothetical protein ESY86_19045 [Subsaximicrobium wynnwilliamsii]|uniref:AbiEi antitoxin C-terminal domain-containing protein n=1 Tax=Subsaximicrobium wynnwilliamsii TaxID=291179 RepID=A0A5C6ZCQ1_9FLAO|nr:DUF6088 family protein [Subsaximicrobium wynnwilliamsii]TXD81116.1 hypothetical protein ESY87_19245 [Subsaximicrobium wynnwilliamsii]TXD86853.1 hypothetical protein ESY86_19045 [Subsaximicrobium wynnwilliamsii]TXE00444.1 hypothetical protein ESY88_19230 [Subsaximicrobium wynnwilliamsii]
MKVAQKIETQIKTLKEGTTFKYQQLSIELNEYSAAAKAMERLIEKGTIKRVSTGIFFKPKQSIFGALKPNEEELLKPYLFQSNKRIAYITGLSLYNRMGLTTQVPRTIKIASRDKRITVSLGNIKGNPVKSYVDVTDKNFVLLEILDALKDFKKIPDLDKSAGIKIISNQLKSLSLKEIKQLMDCALSYPPRVRAFLGALLEKMDLTIELKTLKKSLNPLSEYNYGIDKKTLPTLTNWNMK